MPAHYNSYVRAKILHSMLSSGGSALPSGGGIVPLPNGGVLTMSHMQGGGGFFGNVWNGLKRAGSWVWSHVAKPVFGAAPKLLGGLAPMLGAIPGVGPALAAAAPAVGSALGNIASAN